MDRRHLKVLLLAACAALASCSDDDNGTPTDAAVKMDAPTGGQTLNGCADADFAASGSTVNFGGSLNNTYSPKCLRVAVGAKVTFAGNFTTHPLSPGSGSGMLTTGTQPNPITAVSTGTSTEVTFSAAGKYPYFCTAHVGVGMWGVVQVQ
jgi:plastocyanin